MTVSDYDSDPDRAVTESSHSTVTQADHMDSPCGRGYESIKIRLS